PSQQFIEGQFLSADMVQPGLDDCHSNCLEIVEGAEFVISAQGVQSQLWVPFRIDLHAFAVLQIYNLQHVVADDHCVSCAEPLRDPRRKIQALLDVELGAGNPFFQYHLDVSADMLKHFICSISRLIYLVQQNPLSQLMGFCPLFCVRARLIRQFRFQPSARRAVQPAVSAGSGKDRVFSHSISSAFVISSAYLSAGTSDSLLAPNSFSSAFTCSRLPFRVSSASLARTCSRVTFGATSSASFWKASRLRFTFSAPSSSTVFFSCSAAWIMSSFVSTSTVLAMVRSASTRSLSIFTALSGISMVILIVFPLVSSPTFSGPLPQPSNGQRIRHAATSPGGILAIPVQSIDLHYRCIISILLPMLNGSSSRFSPHLVN